MSMYPGEHPIGPLLRGIVQAGRDSRFDDTPQISLGELIRLIEAMPLTYEDHRGETKPKHVEFNFGWTYPSGLTSWRGSYAELAITFDYAGKLSRWNGQDAADHMDAADFLSLLREAVGKTYEGYKGGDYTMAESTPVWVANWGDSGTTGVVGVMDTGYAIIIRTDWCEY